MIVPHCLLSPSCILNFCSQKLKSGISGEMFAPKSQHLKCFKNHQQISSDFGFNPLVGWLVGHWVFLDLVGLTPFG